MDRIETIARAVWAFHECPWDFDTPPDGMGQLQHAIAIDEAKAIEAVIGWQPIETAPQDGSAILAYGRHTTANGRYWKPGDHWWSILVWDVWREPKWVFSKDGADPWSAPTHWVRLNPPPSVGGAAQGCLPPHPWPKGMRLISVVGECDEDEGRVRETGPLAEGIVQTVRFYPDQGWTYDVEFPVSGVAIVLDEGDALSDPAHYRGAAS
jgi:hypothetical protein